MDTINKRKSRQQKSLYDKISQIDALLAATDPEPVTLKTGITQLEEKWNNLAKTYDEILDHLDAAGDGKDVLDRAAKEWDEREKAYDEYIRVVVVVNESITSEPIRSTATEQNRDTTRRQVNLPKLQLQPFDGDVLKWTTFWEGYENAIHSTDLPDEEKFNYLRLYLRNEAAKCVEGLSLTAASYQKAIDILKAAFGQRETIIQSRLLKLYKLPEIYRTSDTASLRKLYAEVNVHVRELEALQHPVEALGSFIVTLLLQRMPDELQTIWMRDKTRSLTDYRPILDFIQTELVLLDRKERLALPATEPTEPKATKEIKQTTKPTAAALTVGAEKATSPPCLFCSETSHRSGKCKINVEGRKAALMKAGRCFVCIKKGHRATACTEGRKCHNCGGNHHDFICNAARTNSVGTTSGGEPARSVAPRTSEPKEGGKTLLIAAASEPEPTDGTLFMTGQLFVHGTSGRTKCRILIDSCSKLSYITSELVNRVTPACVKKEKLRITGFGGVVTMKKTRKFAIEVSGLRDITSLFSFEAYETDVICEPMPRISTRGWLDQLEREEIPLADDVEDLNDPDWTGEVGLLIGAADAVRILTGKTLRVSKSVLAVETIFGWVVMGGSADIEGCRNISTLVSQARAVEFEEDESNMTKLWELDAIGIKDDEPERAAANEEQTTIHFESTIDFRDDRYHVRLPWKDNHPHLPTNEELTIKRLRYLLRRLKSSPNLLTLYAAHIQDHLDRDFIEEVPADQIKGRPGAVHYLPHRPVVREDKVSTKIRSVFDASAGTPSLNNCLETGPNLLRPLMDILMRFRSHKVALTADIEKAFLQIRLAEEDRDLVRFVWVDDPLAEEPKIRHFRWKSVVFGVTTSPFLLTATLRHHVNKFSEQHEETCRLLLQDMYMDDFISGTDDAREAERIAMEATKILKTASFPLRRWKTNDRDLQAKLSPELAEQSSSQTVDFTDSQSKVLGLVWDTEDDSFKFDAHSLTELQGQFIDGCTKRTALAISSRLFDPLGLISPIIIVPKILLQDIWQTGLNWDDELPDGITRVWRTWIESLSALSDLKIPRHYFKDQIGSRRLELHLFSDASERAYGTVGYLRSEDKRGTCRISIVTSRTRVAPLKRITLPRLELMGCLLSAKLANTIKEALSIDIPTYFWTDSQIALAWVRKSPSALKTFVANRVQTIQATSSPSSWNFVAGKDNPADLCSRGVPTATLIEPKNIWWCGPSWLGQPREVWPSEPSLVETPVDARAEFRRADTLITNVQQPQRAMFNIEDFGTLSRLLRYTTHVLRGFGNAVADGLDKPNLRRDGELTANEISTARNYWFRYIQQHAFGEDIRELRKSGRVLNHSRLAKLNPFLDPNDGLMKLRSRTEASRDLTHSSNLPILPTKINGKPEILHFISLLIRDTHQERMHFGVRDTLVHLRSFCWPLKGRQIVKQVLMSCVPCNKVQRAPFQQPPAPLPSNRCSYSPPFEITGLDFAGPFYVKNAEEKAWMCLFTCAATRAIHLELVKSMATPCFMLALDRFTSRRGLCRVIYSDNGRTFKRAAKEIAKRWEKIDAKLAREMGNRGIEWKFIVEGAPWWGGWWERMVGVVKTLLKKVLGKAALWADELETLMIRVEAVVNSRPITYVFDDHREPKPLRPADFLIGPRDSALPPHVLEEPGTIPSTRRELTNQIRLREEMMAEFEHRWMEEYLQERSLHSNREPQQRPIRLGEVVLIKEDTQKRQFWRMGTIVEIFPGRDGVIRAVRVRTAHGDFKRPVQKVCSLEVYEDQPDETDVPTSIDPEEDASNDETPDEPAEGEAPSSRGENVENSPYRTRYGRSVRPVQRMGIN